MKTVLFVPGFQEDIDSRDYRKTIAAIESAGYRVMFVKINWVRTTITHWVDELNKVYTEHAPEDTILAGFSFGAVTAFVTATERSPYALWLFSLSPYFAEDISRKDFQQSWLNSIGHRRADTFKALHFTELVKKIPSNTIHFYGEIELETWPDVSYRHKIITSLPNMSEVFIPDARHDVASEVYVEAITKAING